LVFSSILLLLYFLPPVVAIYFLIPASWRSGRNILLLVASFVFYGCSGLKGLALMTVMIFADYTAGLFAHAGHSRLVRRTALISACVVSLGLLGIFKYAGFVTENLSALGLPVKIINVALPVGISFFTFQGLSYVIDVYRGDAEVQKNPLSVALYISLFPQLVAGPIVRYTTVEKEIYSRRESLDEVAAGLMRFCFGLGKKVLLANAMAEIADDIFALPAGALPAGTAWVGAAAYTLQIYFDFSGYSDMAIGLGRIFGFHFLENFNYPYIARSITDFWRRWHISLSSWFRDYVYIPLGGNRCATPRRVLNLVVVWLLTGLWHGASWNFVFWGIWFLLFLLGEKYLWGKALEKIPAVFGHVYTMFLVILSWVFFRASDMGTAVVYIKSMFGFGSGIQSGSGVYYLLEYWPEWIAGILACFPIKNVLQTELERPGGGLRRFIRIWAPPAIAAVLLVVCYMKLVTGSFNPFIYFQF
jgi:alginate O-acetyltransferase complex protein AlgI